MSAISLREAMRQLRAARGDGDVVVTTMGASREWMALGPLHPLDFVLVPSSMGQASSLGLGIALARPDRRVVVVNGDGSMLMNLGSLVTIASRRPANFAMVVVENWAYEVTGAQPTPGAAAGTDIAQVAKGCGWEHVIRCHSEEQWHQSLTPILTDAGPLLVVLPVTAEKGAGGPRSPGPARARAAAFSDALASSNA